MTEKSQFTKEAYDRTATSECCWFTPYDKDDPAYWQSVCKDDEMREIVAMEQALGEVPGWARSALFDILKALCPHFSW